MAKNSNNKHVSEGEGSKTYSPILSKFNEYLKLRHFINGKTGARISNENFEKSCKRLYELQEKIVFEKCSQPLDIVAKIVALTIDGLPISNNDLSGALVLAEAQFVLDNNYPYKNFDK